MLSFKKFLLEFDPNRGAAGRKKTIIPHYPTADELKAGHAANPNLPGQTSNIHQELIRHRNNLSLYDPATHHENRMIAYMTGLAGRRWQGATTPETPEEEAASQIAYEAGKPIHRTDDKESTSTPAFETQEKIRKQKHRIRSARGFSTRGSTTL
jgi:hypothetical protein